MILRELYYFDKQTMEPQEDQRYVSDDDATPISIDDTRKTRLTLKDINRARRADDAHRKESENDLLYIRSMYGMSAQGGEEAMG